MANFRGYQARNPGTGAAEDPRNANLLRWFESVDTDGNKNINAEELQRALKAGNLNFTLGTVTQMIRMYDRDQSGSVTFDEFIDLHKFLYTVQESFLQHDRHQNRNLTYEDAYQAVKFAGFALEARAFESACLVFDAEKKGYFQLDVFIAMCAFFQCAANLFLGFDKDQLGLVTVNFSQFVYCAANLRP
eukprot:TRINITY_DN3008_c0_g1_i1.p1 TRINITY_DN3008_c0_g1~~TRINITY_DN3008_c0_g1_i1.p1  ORF type:complete len:189 (-),score=38.22 TRINITY_DN3008_c0_g1_i1:724-1290(-)